MSRLVDLDWSNKIHLTFIVDMIYKYLEPFYDAQGDMLKPSEVVDIYLKNNNEEAKTC